MRILVTGSSRGIGRAISLKLAKSGASLALCASAPSAELSSIVAECAAQGAQALPLTGDLSDRATPAKLVEAAVAQLGGLDAVVSNAGVVAPALLAELKEEDWDRIFSINVRSNWLLARAAYPHLKAAGGGTETRLYEPGTNLFKRVALTVLGLLPVEWMM